MVFNFGPAMLIGLIFMGIGMLVSANLKRKFKQYSLIPSQRGLSGKEIAEMMLADHGLEYVRVVSVSGQLSDHYNPINKTVNLSNDVYHGRNAAAAAVAAHECGHAVQHAQSYGPLKLRTQLVPLQNISGMILNVVMMLTVAGGAVLYDFFPVDLILLVICLTYGIVALVSFVTLPVEFDASKRALIWMEQSGVSSVEEHNHAKDALKSAALTYVVAALGALTTLLYYVFLLLGRKNEK